jgi:hypothetical protein
MPFRVSYQRNARGDQDVSLSVVIEGSNKLGAGLACKYERLFTSETFLRFAEFVQHHRAATDPEPWQCLIDLFPQNTADIEKLAVEQAKSTLSQQPAPLDKMREGFSPFDEGDDD